MKQQRIQNLDFNRKPSLRENQVKRIQGKHVVAALAVSLSLGVGISLFSLDAAATKSKTKLETPSNALVEKQLSLALSAPRALTAQPVTDAPSGIKPAVSEEKILTKNTEETAEANREVNLAWRTATVKNGDSLAKIFKREKLSARSLHYLMQNKDAKSFLLKIHPGEDVLLGVDESNELAAVTYEINSTDTLLLQKNGDQWESDIKVNPLEVHITQTHGTIKDSLYGAGKDAGLDDNLVMELAGIFGWDIDFALDLRNGDHFTVVYQQLYQDGEFIGNGNILAATFTNNGKTFNAIRYDFPQGHSEYFTEKGLSMRKAFLRSPVDFSRISSRFTLKRWHPTLHKYRAHRGVDYAAATGTPIKASGEGKVTFNGWKTGYGRVVFIKHGQRYTTVYAHMSRFKKGIKVGSRVRQGQTIGYVGSSGYATGPHLHYEFRVNGVHADPLRVKLPDAAPIAKKYKADFLEQAAPLLARLESYKEIQVALAEQQ